MEALRLPIHCPVHRCLGPANNSAVWIGVSQVAHTVTCLGTRARPLSPGRSWPVLLTGHWHTGLPSQPGLGEATDAGHRDRHIQGEREQSGLTAVKEVSMTTLPGTLASHCGRLWPPCVSQLTVAEIILV